MEQPSRSRIFPVIIAAGCGALIAIAVLGGGGWQGQSGKVIRLAGSANGSLLNTSRTYACPQCGQAIEWGIQICTSCGWDRMRFMTQAALPPASAAGQETAAASAELLSPREQNAAGKEFIEGHWLGLEVIPLMPELAKEYQVPPGEKGILVDEITLEAAESGILAGDMVQTVDGRPTPDLRAFFLATQRVQEKERADVGISRRGQAMSFFMEARNTRTLGFSQMEAAQPIKPGALSPHRERSKACTECHIVMRTGGQLPTDAGDILPNPPAITKAATATHRFRGQCATCHVIK